MRDPARCLALFLILFLAACSERAAVEPVPVWEAPRVPPGLAVAPAQLDAVVFDPVPPEAPIGTLARIGCAGPFDPVPAAAAAESVAFETFAPVFADVMRGIGLPAAGERPDALRVRAGIRHIAVDLCRPGLLAAADEAAVHGAASLRVCWTIVSAAHGAAVYAVETRGAGREDQPLPYGLDALLRRAFAAATANLAADPGFRATVRAAGAPRRLFGGRPAPLPPGGSPGCRTAPAQL